MDPFSSDSKNTFLVNNAPNFAILQHKYVSYKVILSQPPPLFAMHCDASLLKTTTTLQVPRILNHAVRFMSTKKTSTNQTLYHDSLPCTILLSCKMYLFNTSPDTALCWFILTDYNNKQWKLKLCLLMTLLFPAKRRDYKIAMMTQTCDLTRHLLASGKAAAHYGPLLYTCPKHFKLYYHTSFCSWLLKILFSQSLPSTAFDCASTYGLLHFCYLETRCL